MTTETQSSTELDQENTGGLAGLWQEARGETRDHFSSILQTVCETDEEVLGYYPAESNVHFLLKIIPFIPDLLTRPKKFCLGITTERLIVIRLTNPFNASALPQFKSLVFAAPFACLEAVIPKTGLLTSSVQIVSTAGHHLRYDGMLKSYAQAFADEVNGLKRLHEKRQMTMEVEESGELHRIAENV